MTALAEHIKVSEPGDEDHAAIAATRGSHDRLLKALDAHIVRSL